MQEDEINSALWRIKSTVLCAVSINFDNSISNVTNRAFLCNNNNKKCVIAMLTHALSCDDYRILQCHGNVDTLIVSTILNFVFLDMNICSSAANTDNEHLWCSFNENSDCSKIESWPKTQKNANLKIVGSLYTVSKYITSIHAFCRSNTTSAIFSHGTSSTLKLTEKSKVSLNTWSNFFHMIILAK